MIENFDLQNVNELELIRINELTIKAATKEIDESERAELETWLNGHPDRRQQFNDRVDPDKLSDKLTLNSLAKQSQARTWDGLLKSISTTVKMTTRLSWESYASAAAVLILLVTAGTYFRHQKKLTFDSRVTVQPQLRIEDLKPGTNKATLILGDNSTINPESISQGNSMNQGASRLIKAANGEILYRSGVGKAVFNTLQTPVGGQYKVVLPDKTSVWLNAASSLRFPTSFSGVAREVYVTGEAYFEVSKDKRTPFIVHAPNDLTIRVLGTRFNVQVYSDEEKKRLTLIDGAINIVNTEKEIALHPGEQATIKANIINIANVDPEDAIAWKNGTFIFDDADIKTVMQTLARWYNITVHWEEPVTSKRVSAKVGKNQDASEIFEILEASGYKFKIIGNTIHVLNH